MLAALSLWLNHAVMLGQLTSEGWQVRMRPQGTDRFVSAVFLTIWLCAWTVGGGLFLLRPLIQGGGALLAGEPTPPMPIAFTPVTVPALLLGLWVWTVCEIASMNELLRLAWSEDRIVAGPAGIMLYTSLGPFRKKIEIRRDEVRAIVPSARGSALAVKTRHATIVLTWNGSAAEREEVASTLRSELGLEDQPASATSTTAGSQAM